MKKLFYLILVLSFLSCKSKKELTYKRLVGKWAIEEITYLDKSYKDQLYINAIILKENNNISVPETVHFVKDKNATWKLIERGNDFLIQINTNNTVFNDTFDVKFISDKERSLRGVILKSDTIFIKAFKLLQNYHKW